AAALTIGAVLLAAASPAADKPFPQVIQLPTGFQPEGSEVGRGTTFDVGSVATGAVYRGNLRTGTGAILVPGMSGTSATGIELDRHNRLWVAGASTGGARVFDAATGSLIRTYAFASAPTFINDVVVTRDGAYFTDSHKAVLFKVPIGGGVSLGNAQRVPLSGDLTLVAGFNFTR